MDQKGIEILDKFENPDTDSDYQKVRIDVILLNKFLTSHTGDQVSFQKFDSIRKFDFWNKNIKRSTFFKLAIRVMF